MTTKRTHNPDGYYLLDHDGNTRIFASWSGGYTTGDSWRISSKAELQEETDTTLTYLTASGTEYVLMKGTVGRVSGYNHGVLNQALEAGLTIIREDEDES